MASGGGDSKDTSHGGAIGWGIMAVVFAVIIYVFWLYFQADVRNIIRWIRFSEMWLVSWFLPQDHTIYYDGKDVPFAPGLDYAPHGAQGAAGLCAHDLFRCAGHAAA